MLLNQQAKKERNCAIWVIDPDYKGEIGCRSTEEVRNTGNPLPCLLVSPCPVTNGFLDIIPNGKLQQRNASRTANDPDPSGMKV